jgi:sugar phosphate isomerase/epimerase
VFTLPPLAVSLCDIGPTTSAASPRARLLDQLSAVRATGITLAVLDARAPGLRPRELDQSARRDIAALAKRAGLQLVGLDLWIPPHHWTDPAHAQRALDAAQAAVELAAQLARHTGATAEPVLTIELPDHDSHRCAPTIAALAQLHALHGVTIADVGPALWSQPSADPAQPDAESPAPAPPGVVLSVDPASEILAGRKLRPQTQRAGAARLTDATSTGRVEPGQGRLDLLAYAADLATRPPDRAIPFVTLDVRGLAPAANTTAASHAALLARVAQRWSTALAPA